LPAICTNLLRSSDFGKCSTYLRVRLRLDEALEHQDLGTSNPAEPLSLGCNQQPPRGGISMFARLPDGLDDDRAYLDRGIELGLFSAIPGSAFGAPGCMRFGYAGMTFEQLDRLEGHLRTVTDSLLTSA
jgi:DNA-binding transcriptional MocR family regulator